MPAEIRTTAFFVRDKKVTVTITYGQTGYAAEDVRSYRPQDFASDWQLFISHHLKEPEREEVYLNVESGAYEKEHKTYSKITQLLGQKPAPTWKDFIDISSRMLFISIQAALRDAPHAVTDDDFHMHIHIIRPPKAEYRDWYGDYKQDLSNIKEVYVYFNGLWAVERIVGPFYYLSKFDYPTVYKYFFHEIGQHHYENVKGAFAFEEKVKNKLKALEEKLANPAIITLYASMFELLSEGGGEFLDKQHVRLVDINKVWINEFKAHMEALSRITKTKKAEQYYYDHLSYANPHATYYIGRLMFFTIGLGLLKSEGKRMPDIVIGTQRFPINELNNLMSSKQDIVRVESYPSEHIMSTKYWVDKQTESRNYRVFIRLYDWACDQLGIKPENRAMTWAEFDRWKKQMTSYYKQDQNASAVEAGFSPD